MQAFNYGDYDNSSFYYFGDYIGYYDDLFFGVPYYAFFEYSTWYYGDWSAFGWYTVFDGYIYLYDAEGQVNGMGSFWEVDYGMALYYNGWVDYSTEFSFLEGDSFGYYM